MGNSTSLYSTMSIGKAQALGVDKVKQMSAEEQLSTMSIGKAQALGTQKVNDLLNLGNLDKKDSATGETTETAETVDNTISATSDLIARYGIRQEIITKNNKEDPALTARRKLNDNCKPKEELTVECLGDTMYKVGYGVHMYLPFFPQYADCFMYVKEVNNEWKDDGNFISTLIVTPSQIMDEQEWNDTDENANSSGSGGTELANKIIALLKQQQGKPYEWSAKGPDKFDCSGLVNYCYNQFKDQLINGEAMGSSTYEQVKQGIEIDKSDKSAWQPADLLFWTGDGKYPPPAHVSVFLGNNQMIHAPQTGVPVCIVDITRPDSDLYAVRRVIPEETNSNGDDSASMGLDTAVNCTNQKDFATMVAPYAKELFATYHIFPGVQIANMIQESWDGKNSCFTPLAKKDYNLGGVKVANSSETSATDYTPPSNEGSTPYRKFKGVADFMKQWCIFMSVSTSASKFGYKKEIADKSTPYEQMAGFGNTKYAGDSTKPTQLKNIYNDDNLKQYDEGLY